MGLFDLFFGSRPKPQQAQAPAQPEPRAGERPLTDEETYALQSDVWFAQQVTKAMDRHREGIRNPPQAESEYDEHRWGEDIDNRSWRN